MTGPNDYPEGNPASNEQYEGTLVSQEELIERATQEGVDVENILVIVPRWAESQPKAEEVQSALVRCDLIVRSDGSVVCLDGMMGIDSMLLADQHMAGQTNPDGQEWSQWAQSVTALPPQPEQP